MLGSWVLITRSGFMPRLRDSLPVMVCSIFTHGLVGANYREGIMIEFDRIS